MFFNIFLLKIVVFTPFLPAIYPTQSPQNTKFFRHPLETTIAKGTVLLDEKCVHFSDCRTVPPESWIKNASTILVKLVKFALAPQGHQS